MTVKNSHPKCSISSHLNIQSIGMCKNVRQCPCSCFADSQWRNTTPENDSYSHHSCRMSLYIQRWQATDQFITVFDSVTSHMERVGEGVGSPFPCLWSWKTYKVTLSCSIWLFFSGKKREHNSCSASEGGSEKKTGSTVSYDTWNLNMM